MFAERVMEHLELSGFEIDESRAGHEEAPADPEPRKAVASAGLPARPRAP
jgi:hypothetical protein